MKTKKFFSQRSYFILIVLFNVTLLCSPRQASAITITEYLDVIAANRILSLVGERTWKEEQESIEFAWKHFLYQHKLAGVAVVGQVSKNGQFPTALYDPSLTTIETLSFQFIDTIDGLPATYFQTVSSVLYEVSEDPYTNIFTHLGTSSDISSDFSIVYSISGFEPIIKATPLDEFGNPIQIIGVNEENVAMGLAINIAVPEPSTAFLFCFGLVSLAVLIKSFANVYIFK